MNTVNVFWQDRDRKMKEDRHLRKEIKMKENYTDWKTENRTIEKLWRDHKKKILPG